MSNTSNFDYCVQLGLAPLKAIFHLALKNEDLFPHNINGIERNLSGQTALISVRLLDDETDPADLELQDEKHIRFSLPIEITVEMPDAPDPALSRLTLKSRVTAPGALQAWPVNGEEQLGIDFAGIAAGDVTVPALTGLPSLSAERFENAIHSRFELLPQHQFSLGGNTLTIYDGTRGPVQTPPNKPGNPEIEAALETHGGTPYLKVTLPLHADVTNPVPFQSYGFATFWREVVQGASSISVTMGTEPSDPALATTIIFDQSGFLGDQVAAALKPLLIGQLGAFDPVSEPWFTDAAAKDLLSAETAAYLAPRRFPFYTPRSGDPDHPLTTPVGFLLPAQGILAILMNRRTGTAADDHAPDAFLGANQLALAVSRAMLDETIQDAMNTEFPGVNDGGSPVETEEGNATLKTLTVTPSDPGAHDESEGHLWISGEAEVHIPCWPDPDVGFSGPLFLRLQVSETETECNAVFKAVMGDFDAGQSCCDVFIDLIIPVVGWIMLGVIESMIDSVGGELASQFAEEQERQIQAIPPFVAGVAELQACLEAVAVSSQGLVLPGKLRIRREGRSFEDLAETGNLPRP